MLADVEQPDDEEDDGSRVRSVGGLVMHRLGRIPVAGDCISWRGLSIEVMDMDARRVDKVLVMHENVPDESRGAATGAVADAGEDVR